MKGAQPPFQEYWGCYSPPSPPGSYAYGQNAEWCGWFFHRKVGQKAIEIYNIIKRITSSAIT